ncbi:RagB/SusD family nutrient uptake outer membrane protein [Halosquirtibacter xylanolyticus]|uniref:RagB/SusD family nutrient uptake outer membrane protein n=1 Tax=Halosquirtibacter xylanolyticus TaxID=3374599 RepID=UPI003749C4F7|nr:RagB/SusD family nutrient uptake outer membrane protein [Prolixibacteraceae bacterium]
MKKTYIIVFALCALLISSCEDFKVGDNFLDKPNGGDKTIEDVYSNKLNADQALATCYHTLRTRIIDGTGYKYQGIDQLTDYMAGKRPTAYHDGSINSSTQPTYDIPANELRILWTYIENVNKVPDMTDEEKATRKAEVKVLVAYHYLEMLRYFGGMPKIDHVYLPSENTYMERMTVQEHADFIVKLCDEAAKVLPWHAAEDDFGHLTAAAAKAVKFKTLHYIASPLFNSANPFKDGEASAKFITWLGNYKESRWQDALDAGMDFMRTNTKNGDWFGLVLPKDNTLNGYRDAYADGYLNRNNGEIIFPVQKTARWLKNIRAFGNTRYGMNMPSFEHVNGYEFTDGSLPVLDTNASAEELANNEYFQNPYFKKHAPKTKYKDLEYIRDPRMYENIVVNEDRWQGREAEVYNKGREGINNPGYFKSLCLNGFGTRKWTRDYKNEILNRPFCNAYIRMPEIYLGIAECMAELNMLGADEFGHDVYYYLNQTRQRVGLIPVAATNVTGTMPARLICDSKEKLLNIILYERKVEYVMEQERFFDINRRMISEVLKYKRHIIYTTKQPDGSFKIELRDFKWTPFTWADNWDNKYYLQPIPVNEINKQYGLIQNPGW